MNVNKIGRRGEESANEWGGAWRGLAGKKAGFKGEASVVSVPAWT